MTEGEGTAERSGVSKEVRVEVVSEIGGAGEGASEGEEVAEKRAVVEEVRRGGAEGGSASGTGLARMSGSRSCVVRVRQPPLGEMQSRE